MSAKPKQSIEVNDKNGEIIYEGDVINYLRLPGTLYELEYSGTVQWSEEHQKFGVWENSFSTARLTKIFRELSALQSIEVDWDVREISILESGNKNRPR